MTLVSRSLALLTGRLTAWRRDARAAVRAVVFVLEVLPTLPSGPVDRITPAPVRMPVQYPSRRGMVTAELARPASRGPHPGIVVCLGVVPFGVDHPQVPRLQDALTRAGFATLLYWSPHMRDWRLDPDDIDDLAMAYAWLVDQPFVDPARSGLLGTCVGGAFALMAAATPRIRDRVAFVGAYAPYSAMRTLIRDIVTATRTRDGRREPWAVDPLTRKVHVHSLTAGLDQAEAARLRETMAEPDGQLDPATLSPDGQAIYPLLTRLDAADVETAIAALPTPLQQRLDALSPVRSLPALAAPCIVLMHDRDDPVIPQAESLRLHDALGDRPGVRYAAFTMFKHLDPTKVHLPLLPLLRELGRFWLALLPLFRRATP